jgi:hypothetical protein
MHPAMTKQISEPRGTIVARPRWRKRMTANGFTPAIVAFAEVDKELMVALDLTDFNVPHIDSDVPSDVADAVQQAWARFLAEGYGEWEMLLAGLRLNPPGDLEGLEEVAEE